MLDIASANVALAVQEYLYFVRSEVEKIRDVKGNPVQIPHYDELFEAAGKLDVTKDPSLFIHIIHTLLGRAGNIGSDTIAFNGIAPAHALVFPKDHHMHGRMGNEWYWIGCHVNVIDENNNRGKLSVMDSMQKIRCLDLDTQEKFGWSDQQASAGVNLATVTVVMDNGESKYYRRSLDSQWSLKGGRFSFSTEGQYFFFHVGNDSLIGSEDVLPLRLQVNDGDNMSMDLMLAHKDIFDVGQSFFLQGIPPGSGITPLPKPGIYYSWPQVEVSGTVQVGGHSYTIVSGNGWIDHQLLMTSTLNSSGQPDRGIFTDGPENFPYDGWLWQYYNLGNGKAFTCAGFLQGSFPLGNTLPVTYGYNLAPNQSRGWDAKFFYRGNMNMSEFRDFPSICGDPDSHPVSIPLIRGYTSVPYGLSGVAMPWFTDGSFNNPDMSFASECPANYFFEGDERVIEGEGYIESIGFQRVDEYVRYALGLLKGQG
jgi:hypothetical protein